MELIERYRGAMMGLAAGDALGTTLEFTFQGRFEPVAETVEGGPFGLEPFDSVYGWFFSRSSSVLVSRCPWKYFSRT